MLFYHFRSHMFSPIHPPDDKPKISGVYAACTGYEGHGIMEVHQGYVPLDAGWMWYWDARSQQWLDYSAFSNNISTRPAVRQDKYWFGVTRKIYDEHTKEYDHV